MAPNPSPEQQPDLLKALEIKPGDSLDLKVLGILKDPTKFDKKAQAELRQLYEASLKAVLNGKPCPGSLFQKYREAKNQIDENIKALKIYTQQKIDVMDVISRNFLDNNVSDIRKAQDDLSILQKFKSFEGPVFINNDLERTTRRLGLDGLTDKLSGYLGQQRDNDKKAWALRLKQEQKDMGQCKQEALEWKKKATKNGLLGKEANRKDLIFKADELAKSGKIVEARGLYYEALEKYQSLVEQHEAKQAKTNAMLWQKEANKFDLAARNNTVGKTILQLADRSYLSGAFAEAKEFYDEAARKYALVENKAAVQKQEAEDAKAKALTLKGEAATYGATSGNELQKGDAIVVEAGKAMIESYVKAEKLYESAAKEYETVKTAKIAAGVKPKSIDGSDNGAVASVGNN